MLQFHAKSIDICRISKLLAKYNIKAIVTDSVITLSGDISDSLLTQLCDSINIHSIQNFVSEEQVYVLEKTKYVKDVESIKSELPEKQVVTEKNKNRKEKISAITLSHTPASLYNLIYPRVKRGEIYLCDFGEPYGSEQGFKRYAIIIQNDDGNFHSPTTIVIACTTEHKKRLPVHFHCTFSSENMIDYNASIVSSEENVILAEQLQTVDKTRLRKYIGTLTPDFMKLIDKKLSISLHLNAESQTVQNENLLSVDNNSMMTEKNVPKIPKDLNLAQIQLLSLVDIDEILKISQSSSTDEVKTQEILDLFGFDIKKNGVQYLLKAIVSSPKNAYFNLETLSEDVSRIEGIEPEEIKRLIVARVKETLGFKKAPTIDFIRLINSFLTKQEVIYEETNI